MLKNGCASSIMSYFICQTRPVVGAACVPLFAAGSDAQRLTQYLKDSMSKVGHASHGPLSSSDHAHASSGCISQLDTLTHTAEASISNCTGQ